MQVPRRWVEAYSRGLNQLSERGRAELVGRLSEVDWTRDVATVRAQVVAIMQACCGASATMAARLAADFYDGLRDEFGIEDDYRAAVDSGYEPEATEGAVRAFAQDLVDGKLVEQFIGKCADRLDREVRLSANRCVERSARRDPKEPRWARVPTGPETCGYCIMLASRGFVYHSEDLASHAHAHCDCRVVPSWDGTKAAIEGYDPDLYYDMWRHPEKYPPTSPGTSSTSTPQWARNMSVSVSERDVGLPSGQRNTVLRTARCDVYTTDDGIEVIFPQGLDASKQDMTPQHAIELLNRVPSEIRSNMQRQVFFVDYENPQDAYWRRRYRNFTRTYATGGDEIAFYMWTGHDDDYVVRSYCHEAGHYIDKQNGGISSTQAWDDARTADMQTSGHSSPTAYGNNSNEEDFAESVAEWGTNRADFTVQYPQRASILVNLIV